MTCAFPWGVTSGRWLALCQAFLQLSSDRAKYVQHRPEIASCTPLAGNSCTQSAQSANTKSPHADCKTGIQTTGVKPRNCKLCEKAESFGRLFAFAPRIALHKFNLRPGCGALSALASCLNFSRLKGQNALKVEYRLLPVSGSTAG